MREVKNGMDSVLIALYNQFYQPLELSEQKLQIKECREKLAETVDKQERKLVLRIVDAQDRIANELTDSFICGFKFGMRLSEELRHCNRKNDARQGGNLPAYFE